MTGSVLGNRDGARMFTLTTFAEFTPELSGAERATVFMRLPEVLRDEAWREHDERVKALSDLRWQESR